VPFVFSGSAKSAHVRANAIAAPLPPEDTQRWQQDACTANPARVADDESPLRNGTA
jgi:hypothetical protein